MARTGVADHAHGHDPDRAGPGDQDVFAQHVELEGRVDGVAERVEDRLHVARDIRVMGPDVGHRQRQVLGERAGPVDADPLRVLAQVPAPRQAVAAPAADHVALAADDFADVEILDIGAGLDDLAHELVADHHRHRNRLLRPGIPDFDMNVSTANPGAQHLDEDVVDPDPRARGTSSSQRPGLASFFTSASIVSIASFSFDAVWTDHIFVFFLY